METLLLETSLRALALACAAAVVDCFLRRRAVARHLLWVSVLTGMLALPLLRDRLPMPRIAVPPPAATRIDAVRQTVATALPSSGPVAKPTGREQRSRVPYGWIYFTIAGVLLARIAVGWWLARRTLRSARSVAGDLWMHHDLIAQSGVWASIEESERVRVPVTCGFLPPRIVLPLAWREWPEATVRMVLAHELAHASRHDLAVAFAAQVNQAVFWFHPLAWWLKRRLARLAEHIADERGAAVAPDAGTYARVLIEMAAARNGAPRLAWTGAAIAEQFLAERMRRVLAGGGRQSGRGLRAAVGLAGVALIWLAAGAQSRSQLPDSYRWGYRSVQPRDSTLTADAAVGYERRLAADPDDDETRLALLRYYYLHGLERQRIESVLWSIDHRPGSPLHGDEAAGAFHAGPRPDPVLYREAQARWARQVELHPEDPRVLANAARACDSDYGRSAELLRRARRLDPEHWTNAYATLVEFVLSRNLSPAADLRGELLASTDVRLIAAVARRVVQQAAQDALTRPGTNLARVSLLATELIEHGRRLDAESREWDDLLEGVRALPK